MVENDRNLLDYVRNDFIYLVRLLRSNYSITTAELNKDGTVTVGFSCANKANNIEVTDKEWNFAVRAYRPANIETAVSQMHNFPEVQ